MNGSHQHWTKIMLIWKLDVRNILQPELNRRHPADDTFLKESFIFLFKFHWSLFLGGPSCQVLTHWGRVTHICVSKLTIIGSDNGLSPSRRQAIIWTIAGILLIRNLGTNFSEILSEIYTFSFKKIHLKMASILSRPQCVNYRQTIFWNPIFAGLSSPLVGWSNVARCGPRDLFIRKTCRHDTSVAAVRTFQYFQYLFHSLSKQHVTLPHIQRNKMKSV